MPRSRNRGGTSTPRAGRRHQIPGDADLAAGRMLEPGDAAQRRGLAAAGGTEQHHDLAGRHRKADAVDGGPADRELLAQVGDTSSVAVMPLSIS